MVTCHDMPLLAATYPLMCYAIVTIMLIITTQLQIHKKKELQDNHRNNLE